MTLFFASSSIDAVVKIVVGPGCFIILNVNVQGYGHRAVVQGRQLSKRHGALAALRHFWLSGHRQQYVLVCSHVRRGV